jgi:ribonuclease VapC
MSAIAVDTSIISAICFEEPCYTEYEELLENCPELLMSAATRLELGIVSMNRKVSLRAEQILQTYDIKIIAFDEPMALAAIAAFERFGKDRHKASLNFGDCCSYALAKTRSIPLLYKGAGFALTDIESALEQTS